MLFSTSIGFGALARDLGVTLGQAAFLAGAVYATPAQVVLIDQLGRDASLAAAAFAVTLTGVRLLPMTVTLMPYLRDDGMPRVLAFLASHFVAITAWLEAQRRLPSLPRHLRLSHFLGIGVGTVTATVLGTVFGHAVAGVLPQVLSAALLFITPLYFLLSLLGTARLPVDVAAVVLGAVLGPILFWIIPGLDLLVTGIAGGSLAYVLGRWRR